MSSPVNPSTARIDQMRAICKAHMRAISAPPSPSTFQASGYKKAISVSEAIADIQLVDTDSAFNHNDCLGFALIPHGANRKALRRAPEGLVARQVTANGERLIRDFGLTYASCNDMLKILDADKGNDVRAKAGRLKKKIHSVYDATNQMNQINDVFLNTNARFRPDLQPGPCGLSPTLSKMIQLTLDSASVNGALHRLFVSVIPDCMPGIDDEHPMVRTLVFAIASPEVQTFHKKCMSLVRYIVRFIQQSYPLSSRFEFLAGEQYKPLGAVIVWRYCSSLAHYHPLIYTPLSLRLLLSPNP